MSIVDSVKIEKKDEPVFRIGFVDSGHARSPALFFGDGRFVPLQRAATLSGSVDEMTTITVTLIVDGRDIIIDPTVGGEG